MRVKLLTLRYAPSLGGFDDRPLSEFVRDKEVLAVREHFFRVHELPHLACLVTYQDPSPPSATESTSRPAKSARPGREKRADPAADLNAQERTLFGTMREWRNARSRREGVPAYVILTNRELVDVIRAQPQTLAALAAIEGIGPGKVERHGAEILERLNGGSPPAEGNGAS